MYSLLHFWVLRTYIIRRADRRPVEPPNITKQKTIVPGSMYTEYIIVQELFVYFQVNNGVVYLDYEDYHHHGLLLCSFQ